jgi:hypothetical protein
MTTGIRTCILTNPVMFGHVLHISGIEEKCRETVYTVYIRYIYGIYTVHIRYISAQPLIFGKIVSEHVRINNYKIGMRTDLQYRQV